MKFIRVFIFVLLCILCFVLCTKVNAQVPPPYVPCGKTADPEFHSLRPYQASPCNQNKEDLAIFCGNDLIVGDSITKYRSEADSCQTLPDGKTEKCIFTGSKTKDIAVKLSEAYLPIMGNTEQVTNYKGLADQFNDAQKVNEYVSWYLNGTINRAEYPFLDVSKNCIGETTQRAGMCLNTLPVIGMCLSPNPIPLLPDIPNPLLKADGTNSCGGVKSCCVTINPLARKVDILDRDKLVNYSGPINKLLPQEVQQQERARTVKNAKVTQHDQVIGCTYGFQIPIINKVIIGIPGPCYETGLVSLVPRVELRLSDWANHLPPVRSDYKDYIDYQADYERWRGKSCAEVKAPDWIPIIGGMGVILCLDNALKPNFFSALYPYIPLSSTEDREGEVEIQYSSFSVNGPDIEVSNVKVTKSKPADLFFAHMQESSESAALLQKTYLAKGIPATGDTSSSTAPAGCNLTNIRTNPGDNLFAGEASATVKYDWKFSCVFDIPRTPKPCKICSGKNCIPSKASSCNPLDDECRSNSDCPIGSPPPPPDLSCTKTVSVNFSVISKTPLADKVWSRLVAGPSAIFKRIFPKLDVTGSPGSILDIPAATKVDYTGASPTSGELYFPHIGGISEYFLKGIQTMLRPKGYGEKITFGKVDNGQENLDQCKYTMAQINTAMQQAAKKYQVPESLLRAIFEIEAAEFLLNPDSYICKENAATAAGPMQITRGAYQYVTCENERYEKDADSNGGICKSEGDKLSRCDINDNFELAARTLLWKAGKIADCNATGPMPTDKMSIYNAACKYYGSFAPDALTINYAKGIPASERRQNGNMNYCDIVCHKMGTCPPYP